MSLISLDFGRDKSDDVLGTVCAVGPMGSSESENQAEIGQRLLAHGQLLLRAAKGEIQFTDDPSANRLLNDLTAHPHAFLLGCLMDRQIPAPRAWIIPHEIAKALGTFSMDALQRLSVADVRELMERPKPLHRFVSKMSGLFHSAIARVADVYGGEAFRIWAGAPSSADVVYRFLEFDGVGPKIATMATNILAREFKVPFADYYSIDISADVHVRRVFGRLGLCPADANVELVTYKARALSPQFPGLLDFPSWEIGNQWCRAERPLCNDCYMNDLCPSASSSTPNALRDTA